MKQLIAHARLVLVDRVLEDGWLSCEDGRITGFGDGVPPAGSFEKTLDAGGGVLAPGFIDQHLHGGGGADFRDGDEDAYYTALRTHLLGGTTTLLPTLSSDAMDIMERGLSGYAQVAPKLATTGDFPHLAGVHMEGPYFSQAQKGAQTGAYLHDPDPAEYEALLNRYPFIKKWSVACELPGALDMAQRLVPRGVMMSVGHSDASYDQVAQAFSAGYRCVTHLYSGCSLVHRVGPYRHGGVVEAGLLLPGLDVEVIADGHHLPPELLRLILHCKGPDRVALITDCIRGGGVPAAPGQRFFDDKEKTREVLVENGVGIMPDRKSFAGSVATTAQLVRTMHRQAGVSLPMAVQMASLTPARMLGLDGETGSLATGKRADLVLLDEQLEVQAVAVAGHWNRP